MRISLLVFDASIRQHTRVRRSSRADRAGLAGFTIMELVVVLLVMGIVAAIATPSFYVSLQYHELETAARRVVLDLEQARHTAQVKSQTQTLTFTSATTYSLSAGVASLKSKGETYQVKLASTPYELDGVTLNLGGATAISFDGYGSTTTSGTIVLARGDRTRTLTLNGPSGTISYSDP
ncbi:MAG: GspH/FimT family pseudopilin [Pirellulales bacterium]